MSFTFVTYKIKNYEFIGITNILSNKSEYFKTIDLDKQTEIVLSAELIQNELEYRIFELFWQYINSLTSINFIDDLNLQELGYLEYLTNYFNINLNELEIKYIIEKELEFSEFKEHVYPLESNKDIKDYTKDDFQILEVYPLSTINGTLDIISGIFIKNSSIKNPFTLDLKYIQDTVDDLKDLYKDSDIKEGKYAEHRIKFYENIKSVIEINKIKIKKIILNADIVIIDRYGDPWAYMVTNKIDTYYNYNGFKYVDLLKLIYNEMSTKTYNPSVESMQYNYNSLSINLTFRIYKYYIEDLPLKEMKI